MTPEEEEAVRRALAAVPSEDPMPSEVVARLEATIAELAAVRAAGGQAPTPDGTAEPARVAPVAELEQRRRRWPQVLVAAASVSVLAYGAGAVLTDGGPLTETTMSDAGAGGADEGQAEGGAAAEEDAPTDALVAPDLRAEGPVLELREASLRRDVLRHVARDRVSPAEEKALTDGDAQRYSRRDGTCTLPELDPGDEATAARLDGRRATLVVRAATGGTRVAEVYWCGDGRTLLARTEVPARR